VVWHHGVSKTQCECLEAIQRCALRIIFPVTVGMPYILTSCLHSPREEANKRFFRDMSHPSSCIFSLLPPPRDGTITSRIRSAAIYTRPVTRTKRFTSCGPILSAKLPIGPLPTTCSIPAF